MAEPRIQYAKTKDGVNIAFWTLGEGMPLVQMPNGPISRLHLEWEVPEFRTFYQRLAANRMLVQYDCRGGGLSQRETGGYSLDVLALDLEAVVDNLDLQRFALWGILADAPTAIGYAARHPDRVSHLVLWSPVARGADFYGATQFQGLAALVDKDWQLYTEALSHSGFGWTAGEPARRYAAVIRESVTQEAYQAYMTDALQFDVTGLLPQVRTPTLVLHRRQLPWPSVDVAREIASQVPHARLALLEGGSMG